MKRLLLVLAGYALYRWWTAPSVKHVDNGPPIALPPPRKNTQRRKPTPSKAA